MFVVNLSCSAHVHVREMHFPGLKVRLKLSSSPLQYDFDYMSAPFSLSLRMVNWVDLTANEATYPHIRLHELKEDDSLSSFMSMLASIPATLAVVLINTQDSYDLSKKFNSEEQGSPVPMLVVTKEAGQELLRLVQENTRAIEASVDLSSGAKSYSSPALSSPSPLGTYIYIYDVLELHVHGKSCVYVRVYIRVHVTMQGKAKGSLIHMYMCMHVQVRVAQGQYNHKRYSHMYMYSELDNYNLIQGSTSDYCTLPCFEIYIIHVQWNLSNPDNLGQAESVLLTRCPDFNVHKHGISGSKSCPICRGVLTSGSPD